MIIEMKYMYITKEIWINVIVIFILKVRFCSTFFIIFTDIKYHVLIDHNLLMVKSHW